MSDLEYDPRLCAAHNTEVANTRSRLHQLSNDMMTNSAEVRSAVKDLEAEVRVLCSKVPDKLVERFSEVSTKLDGLHSDFTLLRTQFYWVIGTFVAAGIVAFMGFVLRGGLKS